MKLKQTAFLAMIVVLFHQQSGAQHKWPVAGPASQKMDATKLDTFDAHIANGEYGHVDEMLVIRHGNIVYQKKYQHNYEKLYGELAKRRSGLNHFPLGGPFNYYNAWWHPYYHSTRQHTLQSVTKSVVSVIIGIAMTNKQFPDLLTPVISFFDTTKIKNIDDRKRRMTLRHLLTMTTGLKWKEWVSFDDPENDCSVMEGSFDWVQYVLDKPMAHEPGQQFVYSSGASQLLSDIFRKATGKDIEQYAAEYLFKPLGITEFYWKRTPTGLADTEGGLYLNASDLAKIGYLYLRNGNWYGKQILASDWVQDSVNPATSVNNTIKYGYKWWLVPYGSDRTKYAWCCRGFGGQSVVIIPEYDIVAVFTGWTIIEGERGLDIQEILKRLLNALLDK